MSRKKENPKLRRILKIIFGLEDTQSIPGDFQSSKPGMDAEDNFVFDLRRSMWQSQRLTGGNVREESLAPLRIFKKPIDVLEELTMPPKLLDFTNLDDKIWLMKEKLGFIQNLYSKEQIEGLVSCLENRKKYDDYFSKFATTTSNKIDELLENYELRMESIDIFIPEFPKEAILIMKEYSSKVKEVTGKKAIYYVIATSEDFKDKYEKRDPILLAQSPFGFYYDILGVWDKEMLILSEL